MTFAFRVISTLNVLKCLPHQSGAPAAYQSPRLVKSQAQPARAWTAYWGDLPLRCKVLVPLMAIALVPAVDPASDASGPDRLKQTTNADWQFGAAPESAPLGAGAYSQPARPSVYAVIDSEPMA
jgi:hypothetical protein